MIYTVKPIKKRIMIFKGDTFNIEVDLHPNQRWLVYESGEYIYLSRGSFIVELSGDELNKYFREVE